MQIKAASVVMTALFLAGCAATTPPPRFTAASPADEDGPEARTPPPAPALAGEPEAQAPLQSGIAPKPAVDPEEHHSAAPPAEPEPGPVDPSEQP